MTIVAGRNMLEDLRARRDVLQQELTRLEEAAAQEGGQLDTLTFLRRQREANEVRRELSIVTAALANREKAPNFPSRTFSGRVER